MCYLTTKEFKNMVLTYFNWANFRSTKAMDKTTFKNTSVTYLAINDALMIALKAVSSIRSASAISLTLIYSFPVEIVFAVWYKA